MLGDFSGGELPAPVVHCCIVNCANVWPTIALVGSCHSVCTSYFLGEDEEVGVSNYVAVI